MYDIYTDCDCDVTPEIAKEFGYHLISLPYIIDGKEIYPYESWQVYEWKSFYALLRKGTIPSTAGLSPQRYIEYFEPSFASGHDVLYVHFSSSMSETFNAMNIAVAELKEKYPNVNFYTSTPKASRLGP